MNEVTFAQDAGGGSSVVGQFVAATPGAASAGLGFSKESREVAYSNGQRHISQLAAALRLAEHHQEAAQRLFMLAVQHNFIQGRRTQNVIAACMYTVCRREKTPHMLIDFSDVLQTNVYMLGSCFLKFTRLLSLTLPIIDPSLYIHRFASKLELGDKTHLVSMSALRLVQRMRRDWIQTGRRPSGICGAALLIASRVHGFRRTQREVVRIVRICDVTLRKRLTEFSNTAVGSLTARELENPATDLEAFESADPPSYLRNRRADARELLGHFSPEEQAISERAAELGELRVSQLRERLVSVGESALGRKPELLKRLLLHDAATAAAAEQADNGHEAVSALQAAAGSSSVVDGVEDEMARALQSQTIRALAAQRVARVTVGSDAPPPPPAFAEPGEEDELLEDGETLEPVDSLPLPDPEEALPWWNTAWGSVDLLDTREDVEGTGEEEQQALMDELNSDMEALDASVDCYVIRDQDELELKTKVWVEMNREYIEAQAQKDAARREAEAAGLDPDARPRKPRKKRKVGATADGEEAESAADAADGELRRRNLSSRINYEVVSVLNQTLNEDSSYMPTGMDDEMPSGGLDRAPTPTPQADTLSNSGFSEDFAEDAGSNAGSHGEPEY